MNSIHDLLEEFEENKCLRLGQFFVSRYIKQAWPELFYERDYDKALGMIKHWLITHCYFHELPKKVRDI